MTSIEDLAQIIRDTHGIDTIDAARDSVRAMVDGIADDPDLYNPDTDTLTEVGAQTVREAIAESYAVGAVATQARILLDEISDVAAAIEETKRTLAEQEAERDDLIRRAMRTELRRADIAAAARLGEPRLYQIRDGRR